MRRSCRSCFVNPTLATRLPLSKEGALTRGLRLDHGVPISVLGAIRLDHLRFPILHGILPTSIFPTTLKRGSICQCVHYIYIKYMNHMSSEVRRPRMDLARAFAGTALALSSLERELGPSTPYCAVAAWHLEPWSFFLGLLAGLVLLPLLEIFLALRAWLVGTLAARASSGGNTRPLYKLC